MAPLAALPLKNCWCWWLQSHLWASSWATGGHEVRNLVNLLTGIVVPSLATEVIPNWHMLAKTAVTPGVSRSLTEEASLHEEAPAGCSNKKWRPYLSCNSQSSAAKAKYVLASASPFLTFSGAIRGKFHLISMENHVQGGFAIRRPGSASITKSPGGLPIGGLTGVPLPTSHWIIRRQVHNKSLC